MGKRLRGLSFGLAMLAVLGIGTIAGRGVFAQDATPTPSASSGTSATDATSDRNAFIDAFAAALGVTDQAQIDAAIKTAVDNVLADKVAGGDLTQEQADIIKAEVANGDYRALGMLGMGGGFGHGRDGGIGAPGSGKHGRYGANDQPGANDKGNANDDDQDDDTAPGSSATPAAASGSVSA